MVDSSMLITLLIWDLIYSFFTSDVFTFLPLQCQQHQLCSFSDLLLKIQLYLVIPKGLINICFGLVCACTKGSWFKFPMVSFCLIYQAWIKMSLNFPTNQKKWLSDITHFRVIYPLVVYLSPVKFRCVEACLRCLIALIFNILPIFQDLGIGTVCKG